MGGDSSDTLRGYIARIKVSRRKCLVAMGTQSDVHLHLLFPIFCFFVNREMAGADELESGVRLLLMRWLLPGRRTLT